VISHLDFADDFKSDPSKAIEELLSFVSLGLVTKTKATAWLFPLLVEARGEIKEHIYQVLIALEEPETILKTTLSEYAKYGMEERLTLAAALLSDLGARALPSLRALARANLPECELFVPVIAYLSDVSVHDRLETLACLVSNPSPDVRHSLLWALRTFPSHDVKRLLHALSNDTDEEIADEAQARLESLEA
jgi:hypothetical protein